ncbi:MAG: RIP metalloprotease RseP [Alphaproteobacteria bacterium]|nr:RIP metalloprotease RseP [Alphaproteobacteria bacterium]
MGFVSDFAIYAVSFLVVLTGIVFVHEWGHYIVARLCGVRVEVFSIGFGRELYGWDDRHGTRWKISAIPLGGYVKFFGDASAASTPDREGLGRLGEADRSVTFHDKTVGQRAAIVAAGPVANFIFAILVFALLFAFNGQPYTAPVVGEVLEDTPAAAAGFRAGDRIVAIDGRRIERFEEIRSSVALATGNSLAFTVERDGASQVLEVVPRRVEMDDGFGGKARIGQIGIRSASRLEFRELGPFEAVMAGVRETGAVIGGTLTYLGRFVVGRESGQDLGGPLRIAKMSGDIAQISLVALISLTATLSVSIGLINLFPIPLFDGGHLVFYGIEALRGRPVGPRAQDYSFRFGLAVVLGIFLFATWNDLVHLRVISFVTSLFS